MRSTRAGGANDSADLKTPATSPAAALTIPADETPSGESLLVHLTRALAVAAAEGRADVVSELAAIVGRLSSEERERVNAERGVVALRQRIRER